MASYRNASSFGPRLKSCPGKRSPLHSIKQQELKHQIPPVPKIIIIHYTLSPSRTVNAIANSISSVRYLACWIDITTDSTTGSTMITIPIPDCASPGEAVTVWLAEVPNACKRVVPVSPTAFNPRFPGDLLTLYSIHISNYLEKLSHYYNSLRGQRSGGILKRDVWRP